MSTSSDISGRRIVVVGAGVIGLTTALLLSENPANDITVAAKYMPVDIDPHYASCWAGANYMPVSVRGTQAARWDEKTWPALAKLARDHPESGVHFQECRALMRKQDVGSTLALWNAELFSPSPWWRDVVPNFRVLRKNELADDIDSGTSFTSVCINPVKYLPYLASRCRKASVQFRRVTFNHICEASDAHHSLKKAEVIVNCTGLGAAIIKGVEDATVVPARGQTVLVCNDSGGTMYALSGTEVEDEVSYIMTRAGRGGTILGGSYQKNNWNAEPDPELAVRIMRRAVQMHPGLTSKNGIDGLDILRHGVGFRPVREGGARIEKEVIEGQKVVHCYGHGGYGYQSSYGCAEEVLDLIDGFSSDAHR